VKPPAGHLKLARKLFASDPFWLERRPFSRFEAWLDLLQRAQWRDRVFETEKYGKIELKRGEVIVSYRKFAQRWNRSAPWVQRFIKAIHQLNRAAIQRSIQAGTVYLIVNYDAYQRNSLGADTPGDTPGDTPTDTRKKAVVTRSSKKQKGSDANASVPSSLDRLPKSIADEAFNLWGERLGVVNYGKLRNALLGCVDAGIPLDQLRNAVDAYADWFEGMGERDRTFNRPDPIRFAAEAQRWARLGQQTYVTLDGVTERGRLLNIHREKIA
jgi:hypothetical protein